MSTTARPIVALRAVRSGPTSVHVLSTDQRAWQFDGLGPQTQDALVRLRQTSTAELRVLADRASTSAETAEALIRLARAAEAHAVRDQQLDRVLLTGRGPLAEHIHGAVTPHVRTLVTDIDTNTAISAGLDAAARTARTALVIDVTAQVLDLNWCAQWRERGVAVLPVLSTRDAVVVGPLLSPAESTCARCVELRRIDRDPGRVHLLDPITAAARDTGGPDGSLALVAAGVTGLVVGCLATGVPVPTGVSWSIATPYPVISHHRWGPHPRCLCVTLVDDD